uniref:MAGE domain-containing protein n=1 Tax=Caenorhabditis japonica TaxID=281687 RepID=A0A8R1I3E5_CAEJA
PEKGVVKISDLRKLYQKNVSNDKTVVYRPFVDLLGTVNENLRHWHGWGAVLEEDRLSYVDLNGREPTANSTPDETERIIGVLKNALMFVFVATKPASKNSGVAHDDLMTYLESSISTSVDHKLSSSDMEMLKKQISPNPRAEFIRKGYLSFSKSVNENDEEIYRYEWGPAARQTVDPLELVQVFLKLTGMNPAQMKEQIARAHALRNEQIEAMEKGAVLQTRGCAK